MKKSHRRLVPHLFTIVLLACAAAFASTATAGATVYCVHDSECPAGGVAKDALNEAVAAANEDVAADTVRVGPGTFPSVSVTASQTVSIVGSGIGATELEYTGANGNLLYLMASSEVSDLTIRLTADDQDGIRLAGSARAERVKVVASHSLSGNSGILAEGVGNEIKSVVVDIGPSFMGYAIGDLGESRIEDATLVGGIGLLPSHLGTVARRIAIHADQGVWMVGGTLNLADALIAPYPDDPQSSTFTAAQVTGGNEGSGAVVNLADTTIVGPGQGNGGSGIVARSNTSVSTGNVTANLQGVVIYGVQESIYRKGKSATQTTDVTISHSAYNAATVTDVSGYGTLTVGPGNLTGGADPKFVDPAAGDYRPSFESPLLDMGPPVEPLSNDDPDLAGRSRVRDSDGNGSAVRDIGAYEYQRLAPSATFTLAPATAAIGEAIGFEAASNGDPDGDPVTYSWDFGDGAGAAGAVASHAYAAAGSHNASLTATDATGLSATTTQAANVLPLAPVLTNLSESVRRWVSGAPGTTFAFDLNVSADVHIDFSRKALGRKVGHRCVRKTRRNASRRRCRHTIPAGAMDVQGRAGRDEVRFNGRVPGARMLRPGAYVATFTAIDSLGRRSSPRSLGFKILKRR